MSGYTWFMGCVSASPMLQTFQIADSMADRVLDRPQLLEDGAHMVPLAGRRF